MTGFARRGAYTSSLEREAFSPLGAGRPSSPTGADAEAPHPPRISLSYLLPITFRSRDPAAECLCIERYRFDVDKRKM